MKKIVLLVLMVAVTMGAHATKKTKKKTKKKNDITSVTIHRTICFGKCPDYQIEVNKNGMVTYTGIRFVEDSGVYTKNIGTAKAKEIIDQFKTYRVDTCNTDYPNRIPDLPGIIITVKYAKKTQVIHNAHFGPRFLKDLAEAIDGVGRTHDESWKKSNK